MLIFVPTITALSTVTLVTPKDWKLPATAQAHDAFKRLTDASAELKEGTRGTGPRIKALRGL